MIKRKLISFLLICLLISSFSSQAFAAELGHTFSEQTANQTRTGATTYADITGAVISNTNLTAGKKYLLILTGQIQMNNINGNGAIKTIHGSTDFEGSEDNFEPNGATTRYTYFWYTVWTAVASEDIKLQFKTVTSTDTVSADQITMVAIKLDDDLTQGTDYDFNENLIDTTLAATYGTGNSATLTKTFNGADDILVLATAQLNPTSITVPQKTRINASGGVTDTEVEWIEEGEDATFDLMVQTITKVYTPTASSTTFTTQSESSSATGTRLYNSIFWLNLNKMKNHAFQATQAEINLDTTNDFATSTNVATVSMTPDITGDVWSMGFAIYDANASELAKIRMQIDNTDQPDTQTTDVYTFNVFADITDEVPFAIQSMENLSNAPHTLDVDATKATTARPVEDRLAMMVTMELAPAAPDCGACNPDQYQNQGWIFVLGGIFNDIIKWFIPAEQRAEAQVQEPISFKFKVVPQFTSTRSETHIRNFFNNQVVPKLETFVNNRLQSEFINAQISIGLNIVKNGSDYVVYPKIVISGIPQSQLDTILQKYDLAVDDMATSMLTDLNDSGINNIKWHIHKSFGSINV